MRGQWDILLWTKSKKRRLCKHLCCFFPHFYHPQQLPLSFALHTLLVLQTSAGCTASSHWFLHLHKILSESQADCIVYSYCLLLLSAFSANTTHVPLPVSVLTWFGESPKSMSRGRSLWAQTPPLALGPEAVQLQVVVAELLVQQVVLLHRQRKNLQQWKEQFLGVLTEWLLVPLCALRFAFIFELQATLVHSPVLYLETSSEQLVFFCPSYHT